MGEKKIANIFKTLIEYIIKVARFVPTVFGQICCWIVIIILAIILLYIIINVFANGIANILGIEDAGLNTTTDYVVLEQIVTSGYDIVMPADELQDFYAYEYAVLMDLARNIEEEGVYMPRLTDENPYDPALINDEEWAKLCADTFVLDPQYSQGIKNNYKAIKNSATAQTALANGINAANNGGTLGQVTQTIVNTLTSSGVPGLNPNYYSNLALALAQQAMAEAEGAKPSNEFSKEELVYKSVTSSQTKETSLVPYLIINRPVKIYSYSFEDKSLDITSKANRTINYKSIFRTTKGGGYTTPTIAIPTAQGSSTTTQGYTWEYIYQYIRPLESNRELNANNESLFKSNPPGSSTPLDLDKPYSESIHYSEKDEASVTYEIPLKVLADRFMPKAVLLSSWYMLKQNDPTAEAEGETKTVDIILEQIRDIYSKACLDGETMPTSNWLLVKDVLTAGSTTANTNLKLVFNRKDLSTINPMDEYAFNRMTVQNGKLQLNTTGQPKSTKLLYEKYHPIADSRIVTSPQVQSPQSPNTPPPTQQTLLSAYNQTFNGTLREDIIDDLELVLTHHNEVDYGFMSEAQYEKALQDLDQILEKQIDVNDLKDIKTDSASLKEYVIYKVNEEKKYMINCEKYLDEEEHHKMSPGATHQQKYGHEIHTKECIDFIRGETAFHDNPYTSSSVGCFMPYIKIMFGKMETTPRESIDPTTGDTITTPVWVKSTVIVIINNGTEYVYRVDGKEIEDLAGLTNTESFMTFDRHLAKMTNYSDWDENNENVDVEDRTYFIITDLFEAWPMNVDSSPEATWDNMGKLERYGYKVIRRINGQFDAEYRGVEAVRYIIDELNDRLSGQVFQTALTAAMANVPNVPTYTGGLAVIRQGPAWVEQTANGEYKIKDEALKPPTNAAPDANTNANYDTDQIGEATDVTGTFLNVKGLTPTEIAAIEASYNDAMTKAIKACISSFLNTNEVYYGDAPAIDQEPASYSKVSSSRILSKFVTGRGGVSFDETNKAAIYPVEMRVSTIAQTVKHREMPMYLPRHADTWSSIKDMTNTIHIVGEFDPEFKSENGGFRQLVPRSVAGQGVKDINVEISRRWRINFYAPYFTKVRENDVLAMIAEWEKAGEKDQFAAYTYIRDLYSLIQASKSVTDATSGLTYVDEDSYTYMYVPDEILLFDESVTDKAFWLERILATPGADSIKKEENLTMRNRRSVKTWQIVDYEKYDECIIKDNNGKSTGVANVYALWPLGGYLARSLYAFEANSSEKANQKIVSWGAYVGPGVHSGVDLYGRGNAMRIYTNAFDSNGNAKIKAKYVSENEIILSDGTHEITIDGTANSSVELGEDPDGTGSVNAADHEGNISGDRNVGAYINTTVEIKIDGTIIKFGGSSSAVYGYELYRLTKAYKDGEKAEAAIKEALEEEMDNTPLVAIAPGRVTGVKGGARPGFMVTITHADGVTSNYLHMKRWPEVQVGEYVGAGTIVGYEGTTGNSGGNHIHHEIRTVEGGDKPIYPMAQLYPFFTPFYNEAEVKDKDGNYKVGIESDYLEINRTIFPYGQKVKQSDTPLKFTGAGQDVTLNQVEADASGEIIIKNYVPTKILTTTDKLKKDDKDESAELLERIQKEVQDMQNRNAVPSTVIYNGEHVVSLPQYFDRDFISLVLSKGGHILVP
ncbi:MAG: M23 family metallopeptidase [Clostridia bacterium]|nr:M23 family metallopeptidase [Clostridia bacterium]